MFWGICVVGIFWVNNNNSHCCYYYYYFTYMRQHEHVKAQAWYSMRGQNNMKTTRKCTCKVTFKGNELHIRLHPITLDRFSYLFIFCILRTFIVLYRVLCAFSHLSVRATSCVARFTIIPHGFSVTSMSLYSITHVTSGTFLNTF